MVATNTRFFHVFLFQGILVSMHDIMVKPVVQSSAIMLQKNSNVQITIDFEVVTFTEDVTKATTPDQRGCITDKEAKLTYLQGNLDYEYFHDFYYCFRSL